MAVQPRQVARAAQEQPTAPPYRPLAPVGRWRELARYWGYTRRTLLNAFAFRMSVFLAWGIMALILYMLVLFWRAAYGASSQAAGFSLQQMVAYVVGGQVLGLAMSSAAERRLNESVRMGTIVLDLLRPVSLPLALLAETAGQIISDTIIYGLPVLGLGTLLFHVHFDPRAADYPVLGALILMAFVLRFQLAALVGYTAFWTVQSTGIGEVFFNVFMRLLGGQWVPYAFFPGLLRRILPWTPFGGLFNAPLELLVAGVSLHQAEQALWADLFWVSALGLLLAWVNSRALRHVLSHGG